MSRRVPPAGLTAHDRLPHFHLACSQPACLPALFPVLSCLVQVMELGIGPTVTAGLIIQLLVGSKILDVDTNVKSDRDLM